MTKELVAVVLAGGIGKRFWPIGTSKSMMQFLGHSLLVHNLNRLKKSGITDVIVVANPQDEGAVSGIRIAGLSIRTVVQREANGMAGAVLGAAPLIAGRACFIMNAEDLVEERLYRELGEHVGGENLVLVGREMNEYFPGSYFILDGQRVVGIVEKPGQGNEPSNLSGLVFDYFPDTDRFVKLLEATKSDRDDVFERALNVLLKESSAKLLKYNGYWYPTKYPWHILDIMDQLLTQVTDHRGKNVEIKQNVVIEGPVRIGDNVKIFENTKIVGPCYIGDNTIVGNNNIIRHSHIGANCVTGFNTDITRSYVGDNSWFHSNYVGNSVLEGNVSMGSGTVLANLRLDEGEIASTVRGERIKTGRTKLGVIIGKDVRIGVNTSTMPGVKIGAGSFVGAGLVVGRDIPDASFCTGKVDLEISKNTSRAAIRKIA